MYNYSSGGLNEPISFGFGAPLRKLQSENDPSICLTLLTIVIFCGDDRYLLGVGVIDLDWLARIQISSNYCKSNVNCKFSSKIPNSDVSDLGCFKPS